MPRCLLERKVREGLSVPGLPAQTGLPVCRDLGPQAGLGSCSPHPSTTALALQGGAGHSISCLPTCLVLEAHLGQE